MRQGPLQILETVKVVPNPIDPELASLRMLVGDADGSFEVFAPMSLFAAWQADISNPSLIGAFDGLIDPIFLAADVKRHNADYGPENPMTLTERDLR